MSLLQAFVSLRTLSGCSIPRLFNAFISSSNSSFSALGRSPADVLNQASSVGVLNHSTSEKSNFWASTSTNQLGRKYVVWKEIRSGFSMMAPLKVSDVLGDAFKWMNSALSLKVAPVKF